MPFTAPATELNGLYIAPKFVLNIQHTQPEVSFTGTTSSLESKTGVRAGGAFAAGYDFAPQFQIPVRAELEYGIYGDVSRAISFTDGARFKTTAGIQTLLANVYWDITEWNGFTPYVGLGAGVAFLKTEGQFTAPDTTSASWHDTDTVFAGQVGLGISYAFTESVSADLGYRFLMMDKGEAGEQGLTLHSRENYAHQVMLGLRVTF